MTPEELIKYADASGPNVELQAKQAVETATALVEGYTRGRARDRFNNWRPGVQVVVDSAAARILANPTAVQSREQIGPYSYFTGQGFDGFTLAELVILNRYRKRSIGP